MYQITLSEFPEKLRMLVSQAQLTGDRLEITQDGETVAVISPVTKEREQNSA